MLKAGKNANGLGAKVQSEPNGLQKCVASSAPEAGKNDQLC
jgi:hypothetical protein